MLDRGDDPPAVTGSAGVPARGDDPPEPPALTGSERHASGAPRLA